MPNWWESQEDGSQEPTFAYRAVAYYRHSAQDRQENSISIQQDQVRPWAESSGKEVIYTTLGKPREGDPLYPVYVQFERFRAVQYSRELSDKVFRGCVKIAQQSYWAGGKPRYGFRRLLLDEARQPVQILRLGERKSVQNQRVTRSPKHFRRGPVFDWTGWASRRNYRLGTSLLCRCELWSRRKIRSNESGGILLG